MDRRYYQRTKLNIDAIFFLSDKQTFPREFNGILEDISESGIKVVLDPLTPEQIIDSIAIGDHIHFNSYDEYDLFGQSKDIVLSGDVIVSRKTSSSGKIVLGCKLYPITDELSTYISDKKTCSFCKCNMTSNLNLL